MDRVEFEVLGDNKKLILYFEGKDRGLVLNKTNANNIANAYGDDTDDWIGKQIVLFEAMVDFQGRTVPAIRVRMPQIKDKPKQAVRPASADMQDRRPVPPDDMNDEIPF